MKTLTKEEFEIYCLLFAADADFDITRQDLIAVSAHVDPVTFIQVYNRFELENNGKRLEVISEHKKLHVKDDKDRFFDGMKSRFSPNDTFSAIEKSVFKTLKNIL